MNNALNSIAKSQCYAIIYFLISKFFCIPCNLTLELQVYFEIIVDPFVDKIECNLDLLIFPVKGHQRISVIHLKYDLHLINNELSKYSRVGL